MNHAGGEATDAGAVAVEGPPDLSSEEVEERFRWARSRGHPEYLWPDVPPTEWRSALEEFAGVIAAVLGGDTDGKVDGELEGEFDGRARRQPGDRPRAARLPGAAADGGRARGVAAYTSGSGPLLGYWIETGRVEADVATAALLRRHLDHSRRRAARLDRELERVIGVLTAAGIRPTVIKGAHTGREYFPEAGTRPGADLDLVVPTGTMSAAESALDDAGYALRSPRSHSGRSDWWPPGVRRTPRTLEMVHADDPYSIDLQKAFGRHFGRTEPIDVVGPGRDRLLRPWSWADGAADVIAQPALTAHLALHASEKFRNLTLIRLVELVFVIRRDVATGDLRWDGLHDLLDRTGALPYVYPAFALVEKLVAGTVDPDFLSEARRAAVRRPAKVADAIPPGRALTLDRMSVEEQFFWASGPVEHVRRALRVMFPPAVRWSPRALGRLYVRRMYRLLGRRMSVRRGAGDGS